jgi:HK97 family phage portal protein
MPIVQSFGTLQTTTTTSQYWPSATSVPLYGETQAYATIYATQPNVRTCVDFLSRNIAQLGLHVFRRVSDTDRVRLADHDVANWLTKPNPATTRYRLMEGLMGDLGIYFNAYWLKLRLPGRLGLVRLPPEQMTVDGGLLPSRFLWTINGQTKELPVDDVAYFNGYNPLNPLMGLSPLETLRRILAEEAAAAANREAYWRNAGRMDGVIEQTKDAANWDDTQKAKFRTQWQEFSAGGAKAGMTAVLPKGMQWKQASFSSRDSEYLASRKLSREECAAAYHIPLPMVGILDHATFSNIKEQHKQLYQDSLGPWLEMIAEVLEAQVLVESRDQENVYLEFNIAEKLKGSFEEQAAALHALVGRPIMTANEGRARLNLPASTDPSANELAAQQGGPAQPSQPIDGMVVPADGTADDSTPIAGSVQHILHATRARQFGRLAKVPVADRAATFDYRARDRWNRELADDLAAAGLSSDEAKQLALHANGETYFQLEREAMQ